MKIQVLQVELVCPDRYRAVIRAGDRQIATDIIIEHFNGIQVYEFAEDTVDVLSYFCPFAHEFVNDLENLCNGRVRALPWEYGDFEESRIQHAWEVADSEMRRLGGAETP
jgi:hypothetical protein